MERNPKDDEKHPLLNCTGVALLLWVLLMVFIFLWNAERRKNLTPEQRYYEDEYGWGR